ncbi:MAG: helix-turn-helix domain-containing protein [Bacteroidetes bacterium]|nr:helix-turn-helix domain-containing protein [Bacteroidota bacterium]
MAKNKKETQGYDLSKLNIQDGVSLKFLMLIEGIYNIGVKESIAKYGYSEQRYYQLLKAYKEKGLDGLIDKKSGPKQNSKRSTTVMKQILRHRFLNPLDSAEVIAQKLSQQGITISVRSVERTITEFGIQKKTAIN